MPRSVRKWGWMIERWPTLSFYQRFESVIAFVLTLIVTLIILVALYGLLVDVTAGLVLGILNPLEHKVFQLVFGEILTVLIALEFNHTIQFIVTRQQGIIQTKTVLLIALLALARKFIVLGTNSQILQLNLEDKIRDDIQNVPLPAARPK